MRVQHGEERCASEKRNSYIFPDMFKHRKAKESEGGSDR
jgi:hypothetical protein